MITSSILIIPYDDYYVNSNICYKVSLEITGVLILYIKYIKEGENMITIYTDGACQGNPGQGGWAAILVDEYDNETIISGNKKYTTNNHMELLAALQGMFLLTRPTKLTIVTDSKYVEESFTEKWYEAWIEENQYERPNFELWRMLYNLKDIHEINMKWVKGHAGHHYNERCDELADMEARKIAGFSFEEKKESSSEKESELPLINKNKLTPDELTSPIPKKEKDKKYLIKNDESNASNIIEKSTKKKDCYAVAKGRVVGIFDTWGECEEQTIGFSGAKFKKFKDRKEAQDFIDKYRD